MTQTVPLPDCLSQSEVSEALEHFFKTPADLARALKVAKVLSQGLRRIDPLELLQEAAVRFMGGTRIWPRNVPTLVVLHDVMHSIASNERKKKDCELADDITPTQSDDEADGLGSILDTTVSLGADPSQTVEVELALVVIEKAVGNDEDLGLLVEAYASELRGKEAADVLSWDMKKYDATRKRLSRLLAPIVKDWRTP